MSELKPCPFCGVAMYFEIQDGKHTEYEISHYPNCFFSVIGINTDAIHQDHIPYWNRRAEPQG